MPPLVTARRLFWIGAVLGLFGIVFTLYVDLAAFRLFGVDSVQNAPWQVVRSAVAGVGRDLGPLLIAAALVVRVIEGTGDRDTVRRAKRSVPPVVSARAMLGIGVACALLGFALSTWFDIRNWNLTDSAQFTRDLVNLVGLPVQVVAWPLGIALIPAALIVRLLESRSEADKFTVRLRSDARSPRRRFRPGGTRSGERP